MDDHQPGDLQQSKARRHLPQENAMRRDKKMTTSVGVVWLTPDPSRSNVIAFTSASCLLRHRVQDGLDGLGVEDGHGAGGGDVAARQFPSLDCREPREWWLLASALLLMASLRAGRGRGWGMLSAWSGAPARRRGWR